MARGVCWRASQKSCDGTAVGGPFGPCADMLRIPAARSLVPDAYVVGRCRHEKHYQSTLRIRLVASQ